MNGATLSLSGVVNLANLALISGIVDGSFTPSVSFNLAGANLTGTVGADVPFNWSAGQISGAGTQTINSGNTLTIAGTTVFQDTRTIANAGTTTLGAVLHYIYNGAIFNNSGTYDVQGDGGGVVNNGGAAPAFNNSGTFKKSGGAGTASVNVPFNNTGTVEVQSGTLSYSGAIPKRWELPS